MRKFCRFTTLVALLILAGCGSNNNPAAPTFVLPPTPVPDSEQETESLYWSVVTVTRGDLTGVIEVQGELVAKIEEPLLLPATGLLKEVYVKVGDQVAVGDVIAELDASNLELQVLERGLNYKLAQLEVAQIEAENKNIVNALLAASDLAYQIGIAREEANTAEEYYELSEYQLNQAIAAGEKTVPFLTLQSMERTLRERSSASTIASLKLAQLVARQDLLATQGLTQTQSIQLEIAREQAGYKEELYQLAQKQLDSTVLRAPFSGSIRSFNLQRGDRVDAYQTIGLIADISEIHIEVLIPSAVIAMIAPEMPVEIMVTGRSYQARVATIDPNAILWQGETAQRVTITFDAGQDLPYDINTSANVTIVGETRENVLLLPVEAVDVFPGQAYVDLAEGSTLRRVPVEVGISDGTTIEIMSGLEEGQSVSLP